MSKENEGILSQDVENKFATLIQNDIQIEQDLSADEDDQSPIDHTFMTQVAHAQASDTESMQSDRSERSPKKKYEEPVILYSDDELEQAVKAFKKSKTLPNYPMRSSVIDYVRRLSINEMVQENYDEAAKLEALVQEMSVAFNADQGQFDNDTRVKNIEQRIETAQKQQEQNNMLWDQRIADLRKREEEKIEQLKQQHELDKSAFEQSVMAPEFRQRFTKPSSELLAMRRIQKQLALAKDFEDAKVAKQRADDLQAQETRLAQERALSAIRMQYAQLVERQEREIECAQANSERKVQTMEVERKKETDANDKLVAGLKSRLKDSCLPPLGKQPPPPSSSHSSGASRQMSAFRRSPVKMQLDVKLADLKSIIGKPRGGH